jgi:hypothetical protein
MARRSRWEPWGFELSEPFHRSRRYAYLAAGFTTRLEKYRSLGMRLRLMKGWDLDRVSLFYSASGVRPAGYQPRYFVEGLGTVLSYNFNLRQRLPVTLRLEAAALRGGGLRDEEDVDQLGTAVESILSGPFKTDLFLRLGYGIYSSRDEPAGRFRSSLIWSRRF